ncbi:cell division regulator GpsB [Streptococcus sp. sy010]|uniref:cell division regulator GpsB n=1 Tax=Streptococcus sp. sy010 TaxID=2600148 RepID=UPI0011B583C0|nr:cell division regulator GpsB [Streptococcus sp. sy010]TWT14663.1 cell division regulator GpsB [Streptococcus sp. sy010]
MASIILSPKDIFEQEFKTVMRGFDKKEVDEFLDDVIKDYETFSAQIAALREENQALKKQLANSSTEVKTQPAVTVAPTSQFSSHQTATNLDILKRISRLEKEVFGKQIVE